MLGSWIKAGMYITKQNAIKIATVGGASVLGLGKVSSNGKTRYGNAIDNELAEIEKAKRMQRKLQNMGQYRRSQEEIIEEEIERKMYALRAYILSFITVGDDGYYHILTHGNSVDKNITKEQIADHIDRYADTLEITVDVLFEGDRLPISGPCFKVEGIKIMYEKGANGKMVPNFVPVWQKIMSATIVTDPESMEPSIWFTWNKY